jgi:hypothetical protein
MAQVGSLEKLYQTYKGRVDFLLVYIREAHPGSILSVPDGMGGTRLEVLAQTSTIDERLQALRRLIKLRNLTMPAVIDDEESTVKRAYASWPDRLYVIGGDGKVAYKGRPGPFGFRTPEVEQWLRENVR